MNDILKQRLVGALILLALGVVFWPIVFVQPDQTPTAQQRSVPAPPAVSTVALDTPEQADFRGSPVLTANDGVPEGGTPVADGDRHGDVSEAALSASESNASPSESVANATTTTAPEERSAAPERLAVDADGVPVAWTLQVATVSSAEKAEALRMRLLNKNEKAYVTKVSSGGRQLYRVCVGPKFERHELESMQASINTEFGVKTLLVRYLP